MKNNFLPHKLNWIYYAGFFIILTLPIITTPPYFFPPDFAKTIIFRSIMTIMLIVGIFQLLYQRQTLVLPSLKKNILIWILAGLLLSFLLASIFSVDPYFSFWGSPLRGGGSITFVFYIAFAILAFVICKKEDWSKLWNLSIVTGVLVSCVALIQYYGLLSKLFLPSPDRPSSTVGNPIILAIYLLLLFFLALVLFIKEKNLPYKIAYGLSILIFLFIIVISGSRSAYLGCVIGSIYFLVGYPSLQISTQYQRFLTVKKFNLLKVIIAAAIISITGFIFYVNTQPQVPAFLEKNHIFQSVKPRLSIAFFLNDARFPSWQIGFKAWLEKPLLGWGPENYSVGFDKYYNSSVGESWWDRAHSVPLEIAATEGIVALTLYLTLFGLLFWQLGKLKHRRESVIISQNQQLMAHGIQTILLAYFTANLFSFDSFATCLVFFLLIGYSLSIIEVNQNQTSQTPTPLKTSWKFIVMVVLLCVTAIFLWQYNLLPLKVNAQINKAGNFIDGRDCRQGLDIMETIMKQHSFLDSYVGLKYGDFIKRCVDFYPEYKVPYLQRGIQVITRATVSRPLYTRYWIFLGEANTILAGQEQNIGAQHNLMTQSDNAFDRALQLAPRHGEIFVGKVKLDLVVKNYQKAQQDANSCKILNPDLGDCYWYSALSKIYLNNNQDAEQDMQVAREKKYHTESKSSLNELSDAYGTLQDYNKLVLVYQKLITMEPSLAQYHSSLAFFYRELEEYQKAREEALRVLELSPASKPNIDAFLKTLP